MNRLALGSLALLLVSCGAGTTAPDGGGSGAGGTSDADGAAGATPEGGTGGHAGGGGATGTGGAGGAGGHAGAGGAGSIPACPGVAPLSSGVKTCRATTDCGSPAFSICAYDYRPAGCGACLQAPHACNLDGDCGPDRLCVPSGATGPCFCGLPGTMCIDRCTATSCGANDACDATSGRCKPKSCGAGATCAAGTVCAPDRAGADIRGCAVATCTTDGFACPADYECKPGNNATANGCASVSCVGGAFKCPVNTDCKVGSLSEHQCERRACSSDAACDCGACVQGACQNRIFICSPVGAA